MSSLLDLYPDLCEEWDYNKNIICPEDIKPGCHEKVWWICSKDPHHEWASIVSNRAQLGSGCPICSGRIVCPCGCNSLLRLFPELCEEWGPKNHTPPSDFRPCSGKKVWWRCSKDPHHEWASIVSNRARLGSGCPICSNQKVCPCGCNSLLQLYPELCEEWSPKNTISPSDFRPGSGKKVWWRCKVDPHHEWEDSVVHRAGSDKRGCSICSNYRICPCGCNSLAGKRPDIAIEWDYAKNAKTPDQVCYSSAYKA